MEAVRASGELTIEAWITSRSVQQSGPARIVTLSKDSGSRNFTLGQNNDRFEVRLRTTASDGNGQPALTSPAQYVTTARTHVVFTFDHEGTGRLFVNGEFVSDHALGGDFSNWDDSFQLALGNELSGDRH